MSRPRSTPAVLLLAAVITFGGGGAAATALRWIPCGDVPNAECASLEAPIDFADPRGGHITLRLGRLRAVDSAKRKGVLLIPPGGPGVGIMEEFGGDMRQAQHFAEFQQDYDVVTWDPRGIGKSSPIRCDPKAAPKVEMPSDRRPTKADVEAVASANALFFASCAKASGELFWRLSAKDTAQDMERIRRALTPADGILAYGGSYGSAYSLAYLEAYPKQIKVLILDGVVDHTVDYATFLARNVASVQDSFERFEQWCARDAACALHGEDLGAAYDAAVAREPRTRFLVAQMLAASDHPELGWTAMARMLAEVTRGQRGLLDRMAATANLSGNEDPWLQSGKDGLFRGVMCSDYGPSRIDAAVEAAGDRLAKQAPRFAWKFWDSSPMAHASAGLGGCLGWPREARNPPHPLMSGPRRDVLVSNSTHDSATPLANALSIYLQIPEARLLIAEADGHQSLALSECAYRVDARFLADPRSLPSVTLCGR